MADKMEFPKTMREFIDNHSFKDIGEVYTNGAELVSVFRVEQALEHYEKEIRNKAIDEFVIKLKRVRGYGLITNFDRPFGVTFNKLDEIAEEMKGGAKWTNL